MQTNPEAGLASYLSGLVLAIGSTEFSAKEVSKIRQHLLDALAAAFVGCRNETFRSLVESCSRTRTGCLWPGSGSQRMSAADAAMVWAYAINASVFEDGTREGACHPAAAVTSTVLSFSGGKTWGQIDRALVAGYDVMVRLARGGNPAFTMKGFHPTAITAPFGAAAAAAVLLGFNRVKTLHALALAAMGSAGLMSAFKVGATQPLQVAWAVRSGVTAAILAGEGQRGYAGILEDGFYPTYLGTNPDPPLQQPFSRGHAIQGGYLKPYPGCRHLHPAIDAFARICDAKSLEPTEIACMSVRTYRVAVATESHALKTRGDAYFNIPYALAARAVLGSSDYDAFDESNFGNSLLMALMRKIHVEVDPDLDQRYPDRRGASVQVVMRDGATFAEKVLHPLGEPENPLPVAATRKKFRDAAGHFLSLEGLETVESLLDNPEVPPAKLFEVLSENINPCERMA